MSTRFRVAAMAGFAALAWLATGVEGQGVPQYTAPSGRSYSSLPDADGAVAKALARSEAMPESVEAQLPLGHASAGLWEPP